MPYAMVPSGYRAVPIGQAANIEELGTFTPLEEGAAEGAFFLLRLDFEEIPSQEALAQLERARSSLLGGSSSSPIRSLRPM